MGSSKAGYNVERIPSDLLIINITDYCFFVFFNSVKLKYSCWSRGSDRFIILGNTMVDMNISLFLLYIDNVDDIQNIYLHEAYSPS